MTKEIGQPRLRDDAGRGRALRAPRLLGMFATHDQKEGMAAFAEKRKPAFKNR
jgi:enoyl-CoA hydratase